MYLAVWGLLLCAALAAPAFPGDSPTAGPLAQGLELFHQGRRMRAEPLLREGLTVVPDNVEGLLALTRIYLGWTQYAGAIARAERAVKLAPQNAEAQLLLAQARGLKAQQISRVRGMFLVGDIRSGFQKAVALDPKNVEARLSLMEFYLQAPGIVGGDLGKARAEAEAAVALDPLAGLPAVSRVAQAQGKTDESKAALDRLAAIDKGKARVGRALLYVKDDKSLAARELTAVAVDDPRDPVDLTTAGMLLGEIEHPDEALALYEQARKADPSYLPAAYQLGRALLLSKKELPRAESAFKEYLAGEPPPDSPRPAAAHWRLGMVYQAQGRSAEARREYEEALRLDPDNQEARKSLSSLKS